MIVISLQIHNFYEVVEKNIEKIFLKNLFTCQANKNMMALLFQILNKAYRKYRKKFLEFFFEKTLYKKHHTPL